MPNDQIQVSRQELKDVLFEVVSLSHNSLAKVQSNQYTEIVDWQRQLGTKMDALEEKVDTRLRVLERFKDQAYAIGAFLGLLWVILVAWAAGLGQWIKAHV